MSLPIAMDFAKIRKTEDGKVSVVDVIAQVKKCTTKCASEAYKRLLVEERVPECEVRILTSESQWISHSHRHSCRDNRNHLAASRRH